jgi:eukaryotic-like serine/threonine-protein kinase
MPEVVDRYRVRSRLGAGAFATVWLAEDDLSEGLVAVKVLADNWAHQPDVRARFLREARILSRVDSERLVRVIDIGELPDGRPYLVMTYVAGGTLADRLAGGPMPVADALRTGAEIARAVADLHGFGVLHRDLKPSNVLIDGSGDSERVRIADLGLAKAIADASGFTVVAGSPAYMAPEQARPGGGLDVRADVYAVGALVYHMITGRPPSRARSVDDVAAKTSVPTRPSVLRPGVPAGVDDVVLRALRFERERRWPSAAAFAEALDRALRSPYGGDRTMSLRWARGAAVAAVAVAAVLATAGSAPAPRWVRVHDASGDVSVSVPSRWAEQLMDSGWDPWKIGLPTGRAPGLLVGTDLTGWPRPAHRSPSVFVGVSRHLRTGGPNPQLPGHGRCVRQPDRDVTIGGLAARVFRWTGCEGTPVSFSEVLLIAEPGDYGIYVQVKQIDGVDLTDRILSGLRAPDQPVGAVRGT